MEGRKFHRDQATHPPESQNPPNGGDFEGNPPRCAREKFCFRNCSSQILCLKLDVFRKLDHLLHVNVLFLLYMFSVKWVGSNGLFLMEPLDSSFGIVTWKKRLNKVSNCEP